MKNVRGKKAKINVQPNVSSTQQKSLGSTKEPLQELTSRVTTAKEGSSLHFTGDCSQARHRLSLTADDLPSKLGNQQ